MRETLVLDACDWPRPIERRTATREGYLPPALLLTAGAYHATGNPRPQEIFRAVEDYYKGLFVSLTLSNKLPPHTDYHGGTLRMTGTFMWKKNAVCLGRLFFIGPKLEWHLDKFKVQQWCAWDDPDYTLERVEQMVDHDSAILDARLRFNDLISDEAPGLSDVEREELWKCLRDPYREVWIDYRNEGGETSSRRIGRVWLEGESIHAYCHLRGDKRTFRIDRIGA